VYRTGSDDFRGMENNKYDIIIMDEFDYNKYTRSFLLTLLEGKPTDINMKYGQKVQLTQNMPIILIMNSYKNLNSTFLEDPAFKSRYQIAHFKETFDTEKEFPYTKEQIIDLFFKYCQEPSNQTGNINIGNINIKINNNYKNKN
jgi:hypothetical protein